MAKTIKAQVFGWIPYVIGAILVVQFFALSVWQISRGMDKTAEQEAFESQAGFSNWSDGMDVRSFQKLKATGTFNGDRQVLLENIIINSRYGVYVITPLAGLGNEPVLLVNRGWLEKMPNAALDTSQLDVTDEFVTVRGRVGSLPRAGMKMGDAVSPGTGWPKTAVYPSFEEVAAALGREVQPFVLLMDHEEANGFYRHWVPTEFGPGKHFGYALQWFAMGAVLSGLLIWNYRKKKFK